MGFLFNKKQNLLNDIPSLVGYGIILDFWYIKMHKFYRIIPDYLSSKKKKTQIIYNDKFQITP